MTQVDTDKVHTAQVIGLRGEGALVKSSPKIGIVCVSQISDIGLRQQRPFPFHIQK